MIYLNSNLFSRCPKEMFETKYEKLRGSGTILKLSSLIQWKSFLTSVNKSLIACIHCFLQNLLNTLLLPLSTFQSARLSLQSIITRTNLFSFSKIRNIYFRTHLLWLLISQCTNFVVGVNYHRYSYFQFDIFDFIYLLSSLEKICPFNPLKIP